MGPWLPGPLAAIVSHFMVLTFFPVLVLSLHCDYSIDFKSKKGNRCRAVWAMRDWGMRVWSIRGWGVSWAKVCGLSLGCEGSGLHRPHPQGFQQGPV